MIRRWRSQYWFSAAVCLLGSAALVASAYACLLIGVDFAAAGFSLLTGVVVISTFGSYLCAVVLSIVAAGCLSYFFSPPIFFLSCGRARRFDGVVGFSHDLDRHHGSCGEDPQDVGGRTPEYPCRTRAIRARGHSWRTNRFHRA